MKSLKKIFIVVFVFLGFCAICAILSEKGDNTVSNQAKNYSSGSEQEDQEQEDDFKKGWSVEKINCFDKAQSYLDMTAFSKKGLINQLKFEKYPESTCKFVVNKLEERKLVNWNEQCVKKAQSYLEMTAFSKDGLYKQLKFEKFTDSQCKYAVKKVFK